MIVKDGDSRIVQFSHFSVKEFLTANRLAEPIRDVSRYHIRLEAAHTILAQACLGVLLRLDDRVDLDNIKTFPMARYAAQYWPTHARFENASSQIKDGMECLFDADKPHFATWLWIYDQDTEDSMLTMCPEKPDAVPLYYAARHGFRDLAEHLIAEHPKHVNARGGYEGTPMHVAASTGHADILSLLLEHGAKVDMRDKSGRTPLYRASEYGQLKAGQLLLDRGADIKARSHKSDYFWTPLFRAVLNRHFEYSRMLLKRGAVIDAPDSDSETVLHMAVHWRNTQTVQFLLEHGADVNVRNKDGQTPVQIALDFGLQEIVELMSKYCKVPSGATPGLVTRVISSLGHYKNRMMLP
jgi:ankyrin repeat protein